MNKTKMKPVLIFLVVLVVLFWVMPNQKIILIGDFFEKILQTVGVPVWLMILGKRWVEYLKH